jgi:nucleoporin NDC1
MRPVRHKHLLQGAEPDTSLIGTSHLEDKYGVAQLSGYNKAMLSSLLSCLLVVEVYLGHRSSARGVGFVGPNNIK